MSGLADHGISVVVPAFNEERAVTRQVEEIHAAMRQTGRPYEIIVVDDGSTDRTADKACACDVVLIRRDRNYGYGSALKAGIAAAQYDWILIIDADQTYPSEAIPALLDRLPDFDMVVGARTGKVVQSPLMRKAPKWFLRQYASYLVGRNIPDLNSGMRVMRKAAVERFLDLLPSGFSFTTTITLAMISNGYKVFFTPIDYFKRVGKSKIRATDFFRIFALITRLMLMFRPTRLLATGGALALLVAFILDRLTPLEISTAEYASMSALIMGLAGVVEYRSHQFRIPRVNLAKPKPKLRDLILRSRGLRLIGSIVLLFSLTLFLPKDKILQALRVIHPGILAATIPLVLLVHTVGSWKWHLLVNEGGARLPFLTSVRLYFSGLFGNLFLPSIVGGDAVIVALGLKETHSRAAIVLGSVVNRVLDMASLVGMSLLGAALLGGGLNPESRKLLEGVLVTGAAAAVVLLLLILLLHRRLPASLKALQLKHQPVIRALRNPRTYAAPFLMSIFVQLSLLTLTAWIADTCGLHIALGVWFLAWPLAKLVALLPFTTGGLGAREVALVALLRPFGVPPSASIAVALAWDGVLMGGSLFAGLISRVLAINPPARAG